MDAIFSIATRGPVSTLGTGLGDLISGLAGTLPSRKTVTSTGKGTSGTVTAKKSFWDTSTSNFARWDSDKNGKLTNQEIISRLRQKGVSSEEKAALETLRGRQEQLEEAHDDEWGDENDGISKADLGTFRKAGGDNAVRLEEQFRIERGLAEETPQRRDRNKPADLSKLEGKREYYIERYKDFRRRNPEAAAPDYYMDYGLKYYDRFQKLKPELAPESRGWVDRTKVALQDKMEARRVRSASEFARLERNPEVFRDFAYETHPAAYLESGLKDVPYGDRMKIATVPDSGDLWSAKGLGQAVETGAKVVTQDIGDLWDGLFD